jgi:ABC-type phosphate transport system permease subunit
MFGVFLGLLGLLGLFGIAIFLIEGGDTETLMVSLALGLLITPFAVLLIIAALKYKKQCDYRTST